ncbi:hypothetical protein COCON_G00226680 [Conger conger]|uniref:Uncharacterized protein n=1 Tax=Conger conger TaxID=82655 RepID=A0A9Q1CWX8_CONCO|nr:hypothetical protein COCON_G00226680 [Conger conger]
MGPRLKRDGAPPGGPPKSGSESALRDRLALLERNTRRPVGEREEAVLHVLPLFIELFQSGSAGEDLNLQVLAAQSAEIVVLHVQQKLSEKPAEEARYEVELFFRRNAEVRANKGWLLLQCLALLSAGDSETVTTIIRSGLPAALIKCLYLFVSLPPEKMGGSRRGSKAHSRKSSHRCSCSCAGRVLRAVSAAQTKNTVPALQAKNCMKICIQNLLKIPESVPGPVLAEVAVGVFGFVRDSYPSNPALFHEFENNEGYTVLQGIMSRCEEGVTSADLQALEEFLGLIASLTLCGKAELKVALCVNNPQPPGFKFDPVLTKGSSVKNLTAFRILQSSFLRSGNAHTCAQVLLAVRDIWSWDKANFFLLEWTLQSLAQLGECVWRKPAAVHGPFFRLLETVVLQLNYIPHEALRKLQAAFLQSGPSPFAVATLASYRTLCARSGLFCEVLCDSGVLDLLLGHLRKRAKVLRKAGITGAAVQSGEESCEKDLVRNMLDVVAVLALKSVKNTVAIRDCGMIPYIKIFLDEEQLRSPTLILLEQLSVINPEEYMSITIGALCSSTHTELALKRDLLQSVLKVLESPNSWNAFRTAGGFDGVLSLLRVRELVLLGLHTVALAVHLHPVNAHAFHTSQQHAKMADALLQLGCFCQDPDPGRNRDDDPGRNRDDDPGRNRDDDPGRNRDDDPGRNRDDDPGRNRDGDPGRNRDGDPARNHDYDPGRNRDDDPSRNCDDDPDPDCSRTFQQFVEAAETPEAACPRPYATA